MLEYDASYKACDVCGREHKTDYRRYYCERCDKYFFVCPTCITRDKVPCRFCGVGLRKKKEPLKKMRA